jgi:hypothetical protein
MTTCEQCGMVYKKDLSSDVRLHKKKHEKWLKASQKYGLLLTYSKRENLKKESEQLEDQETAKTLVYWAWFCRSVEESGYSLKHMSFPEYVEFMDKQQPNIQTTTASIS